MAIWVADPAIAANRDANNDWIWNVWASRKLGVIHVRTLDGIWDVDKAYMPAGRNIREIFCGLTNPTPAVTTIAANWYSLKSDAGVLAFLQIKNSKPIWLLVVLQGDAAVPPNTPSHDPLEPYCAVDKFQHPLEYDDHPEDRDALVRNVAGVACRRMPTKDYTFEERRYKTLQHIACQQEIIRSVQLAHKCKFPGPPVVIVDSEDEDYCYIRNLRNHKPTTRAKIVTARQDIAARCRATRPQCAIGVGKIVIKVRGINAAQYTW